MVGNTEALAGRPLEAQYFSMLLRRAAFVVKRGRESLFLPCNLFLSPLIVTKYAVVKLALIF